jgi:hypothetical protein
MGARSDVSITPGKVWRHRSSGRLVTITGLDLEQATVHFIRHSDQSTDSSDLNTFARCFEPHQG